MKDKTHDFMTNTDYEKLKERYLKDYSDKYLRELLTTCDARKLDALKKDELKAILLFFKEEKNIESRLTGNKPDYIDRIRNIMTTPHHSSSSSSTNPSTSNFMSKVKLHSNNTLFPEHPSTNNYLISGLSPVPTATAHAPHSFYGNSTPTTPSLLSPLSASTPVASSSSIFPSVSHRFTLPQPLNSVKVEDIQTSQKTFDFSARKLTIEEQLRFIYFQQDRTLQGQISPFIEIEELMEFKFIHPNGSGFLIDLIALDAHRVRLLQSQFQLYELQVLLFASSDKNQFKPMNWPNDSNVKCNGNILSAPKINKKLNKKDSDTLVVADPLVINYGVLQPGIINRITMTTQQTLSNALFLVVLVKKHGVELLAERVRMKQNTLIKPQFTYQYKQSSQQVVQQEEDDDLIIEDKEVMSLKDPISLKKIKEATKGTNCGHKQCFDLKTYLNFCQISKLWNCPFCDKRAHYSELFIVDSMNKILHETVEDADKIVLNPDGTYELLENPLTGKPLGSNHTTTTSSSTTAAKPSLTTATAVSSVTVPSTSSNALPVVLVIDDIDNPRTPEQLHHGDSPASEISLNYSEDEDELVAPPQTQTVVQRTLPPTTATATSVRIVPQFAFPQSHRTTLQMTPTKQTTQPTSKATPSSLKNDGKTWNSAIEID